jgi:hypothetical protein
MGPPPASSVVWGDACPEDRRGGDCQDQIALDTALKAIDGWRAAPKLMHHSDRGWGADAGS